MNARIKVGTTTWAAPAAGPSKPAGTRHGRSPARFKRGRSLEEGARYLYSRDELAEWVPRIRSLRAREVHVLFNNAVADYAVRNARDLIDLLPKRRRA